jgi:sialate O-acetylesterase
LIASSHGGVSLKDWARPKELNADSYDKTLYGAMIDRIRKTGGHIAGILWYQGESDALRAEDADTYGDRFRDWLKLLRADTRTNLPVVFVQLGPHRNDAPDTIKYWMTVQDQQRKLIGENDYTACVTAIDCSLDDKVHISKDGLNILGKRLATAAILTKKGDAKNVTPTPKSATYQKLIHIKGLVEVHTILLQFNLPDGFKFNSGSADVIGFDVQNQNNVAILRTRVEEDAKSIRIYLTGSPSTGSSQAYVNYGMNQTSINLNYGEDRVLPAFKNLLVATQ